MFESYRWYLLPPGWLNEPGTDGIYMVGSFTRGGVLPQQLAVPVVARSYNAATNMFPESAHASHSLSVIHPAAVLFIHLAGRRWGKELMCGTEILHLYLH